MPHRGFLVIPAHRSERRRRRSEASGCTCDLAGRLCSQAVGRRRLRAVDARPLSRAPELERTRRSVADRGAGRFDLSFFLTEWRLPLQLGPHMGCRL
jgi:hypothetical protein